MLISTSKFFKDNKMIARARRTSVVFENLRARIKPLFSFFLIVKTDCDHWNSHVYNPSRKFEPVLHENEGLTMENSALKLFTVANLHCQFS